jgi:hypothetical protein
LAAEGGRVTRREGIGLAAACAGGPGEAALSDSDDDRSLLALVMPSAYVRLRGGVKPGAVALR